MNKTNKKVGITKHINIPLASIFGGFLVLVILLLLIANNTQQGRKNEELAITKTYSAFQSELVKVIEGNIILLKGYLAYLETSKIEEVDTIHYLERLTADEAILIRNVTVIEDTTIKWVYPLEGNEAAIGKDLATIDGQKDIILAMKEYMKPTLQGPVNLIQGGVGYIARLPVIGENGSYWGQLSIVLDADKLLAKIEELAQVNGIQVHIQKNDSDIVIFENQEVITKKPINYIMRTDLFEWKVSIVPYEGWRKNTLKNVVSIILSLCFSFLVAYLIYYNLHVNVRLKELASRDSLTGLYNRHFLDEYQALVLSRADRYRKNVGFLILDLDHFKEVNDSYGHKIGDLVLIETAKILLSKTRTNETVFRLGGDEFLIIFPEVVSIDEVNIVKNRLVQAFSKAYVFENHKILIEPSIGIGMYPQDGTDFDHVMFETDSRMYIAKEKRR